MPILDSQMAKSKQSRRPIGKAALENARAGYQAAVNLWIYEGATFWAKFTGMILANTIVLTAIALVLTGQNNLRDFKVALCIFGIVIGVGWMPILNRSFDYYTYWLRSARELEEKYLKNEVNTISRGGRFAEGHKVRFEIKGLSRPYEMSCLGGLVTIRAVSNLILVLFIVLYGYILYST